MKREHSQKTPRPPLPPILPRESVEIAGRREMLADGVCGIAAYSKECIRIKTKCGIIAITGSALTLCWSGEHRLLLRGNIQNIAFESISKNKNGGGT